MSGGGKLALIAGGGGLPVEIAAYLRATGRPYIVIRIEALSDEALDAHPGYTLGLGDFLKLFEILSNEQCRAVCMCGYVQRPDFDAMKRDEMGARVVVAECQPMPGVVDGRGPADDERGGEDEQNELASAWRSVRYNRGACVRHACVIPACRPL